MTAHNQSVAVLCRALDQAGDVLAAVRADQLAQPTPCDDWDVAQLIGHLVSAPARFLERARGADTDWSAAPQPAASNWVADFRSNADELIHHWRQPGDAVDARQVDWQTAEIAVHTWDLARATGQSPPLQPEVAERGLAFMSAMMTPENRGKAFAPAVRVPDDAPIYDRLAAFAGRALDARTEASGPSSA
ncbi:TIGR03086 family metal-binding protein [Microlunatus panaciterrae]|uniref:Uncharacterized protein (TIGR03086 family) n=1 Tax=Microlunatus panaciterrae TaxID=400768 RepID=A0ABS2RIA8_9ACTN|nr:TIGR03086 family metal-binding protein [Microlunatus panaciterrae]MBM7798734.1 uncharacterized protein (TIGR03086 family) [Microlunatus panaciterrae]